MDDIAATSTISLDSGTSETEIINWLNKHDHLQEPPPSFTGSPRRKHRKMTSTGPFQKPHPLEMTRGRYLSENAVAGDGRKEEMIELKSLGPPSLAHPTQTETSRITVLADAPITQWGRLTGKTKSSSVIQEREQGKKMSIVLIKSGSQSLGFSLCGGKGSKRGDIGLYIRAIQEGGAAYKDGRMKPGDELVAVNGVSLKDYTHKGAAKHIKVSNVCTWVLALATRAWWVYKITTINIACLFQLFILGHQDRAGHVSFNNWSWLS